MVHILVCMVIFTIPILMMVCIKWYILWYRISKYGCTDGHGYPHSHHHLMVMTGKWLNPWWPCTMVLPPSVLGTPNLVPCQIRDIFIVPYHRILGIRMAIGTVKIPDSLHVMAMKITSFRHQTGD